MGLWLGPWFLGVSAGLAYLVTMLVFYRELGGFNYSQHYSLLRAAGQPIEPRHAWNQLKPMSRSLSFEISNHSGHHLCPTRVCVELEPYPQAPRMPSIILCFLRAFLPTLWEGALARPRLEQWDQHLASDAERALARQANKHARWPQWLEPA